MNKIKDIAPEIGLLLFTITACAGFLMGKLGSDLFAGALMAIMGSYYGASQAKSATEQAMAAYKNIG